MEPETKEEWLAKMERYMANNPKFAMSRAKRMIGGNPTDWDENIPVEWAVEFLQKH